MRFHTTPLLAGFTAAGLLLVGLGAMVSTTTSAASDTSAEDYLWMLTADGGTIQGIGTDTGNESLTLTLSGVNDHATQFADRPARDAFVISTTDFADRWDDWFGSTPPNAVLSYQVAGEVRPHDIVLEIDDPQYNPGADTLTFTARHLHRASDPHPDAMAPIEVAPRSAPRSFRGASLFIDSAGDAVETGSADPSESATPEAPSAEPTSSSDGSAAAEVPASMSAASTQPSAVNEPAAAEVASILSSITVTDLDLRDGTATFDPASTATPPPGTIAAGTQVTFETKVSGNPATATVVYQVYELGAPSGIWVRAQAQANLASSDSRDTSSCDFYRGNPASGGTLISDDSNPYECSMSYLTTADPGKYVVNYSVAPQIWATVRGSITPTGDVSLTAGEVSAENTRWDFNGKAVTGALGPTSVAAGTSDTWIAYHRGDDDNVHAARVDYSYQIVDDGVVTQYWVAGYTENYRGAAFDHTGECTIYDGNPFATEPKVASLSPYTCVAEGANVSGRGDWKVDFTLSALPAKVIDATTDRVLAGKKMSDACGKEGATCDFIPFTIVGADLKGVRVSKKVANATSEPVTTEVGWSYTHDVTNSASVEIDLKDSLNYIIEDVTATVKAKWSVAVSNAYTTTTTNTLTVPPGCRSWWDLAPAYKVVTGDFVVSDDGLLYRIKGISWSLPEAATSGNDGGLMGGTLTARSEPILEGSKVQCSMPASGSEPATS